MEDGLSKEAALKAYHNIFKTTCGKMICREMFNIWDGISERGADVGVSVASITNSRMWFSNV